MAYELGFLPLLVILLALLVSALRILREYERGVVFQLGRFWKVKGPGLILVIPGIQQMVASICAPSCWMCRPRT
jgi:regulator of protease activity HflC (stomatin/prohibitin superfamily)